MGPWEVRYGYDIEKLTRWLLLIAALGVEIDPAALGTRIYWCAGQVVWNHIKHCAHHRLH